MDKGARFVYGLSGENSHGVGKEKVEHTGMSEWFHIVLCDSIMY